MVAVAWLRGSHLQCCDAAMASYEPMDLPEEEVIEIHPGYTMCIKGKSEPVNPLLARANDNGRDAGIFGCLNSF